MIKIRIKKKIKTAAPFVIRHSNTDHMSAQPPPPTGTRATFTADYGETLQYKIWAPATGFKRAMLLLHRGHEHADRWDAVVPHLALPDTAIFAWEARGHGQSPGRRGQRRRGRRGSVGARLRATARRARARNPGL